MTNQQTIIDPGYNAASDNQKQPPQRTLEQAQQRYDDLKDQRDKQMDHAQRLLGLCALSGFISLLAKPTWATIKNYAQLWLLTGCIVILLGIVVLVAYVIINDLYNPIKTPMLLGTATQVQSPQSGTAAQTGTTAQTITAAQTVTAAQTGTTAQTVTTTQTVTAAQTGQQAPAGTAAQTITAAQTDQQTQTDQQAQPGQQTQAGTAAQPQARSTVDESDALIDVWEEQSDKLEKLNDRRRKIIIGAYAAYTFALDGIIVCLFPV